MYITFYRVKNTKQKTKEEQLNLTDLLLSNCSATTELPKAVPEAPRPFTINVKEEDLKKFFDKNEYTKWYELPKHPDWPAKEVIKHYDTFYIPKKTGGMRRIDAPDQELYDYLKKLKEYFENTLKILPHDAAHAYVKGRSIKTDMLVHQENESKWFAKFDFHGFFPSTTKDFVVKQLEQIYPLGFLLKNDSYRNDLLEALDYAFLNGGLPQGTSLSPTLTNIMMVPLDYIIQHKLYNLKQNYRYTRYADDIQISSKYKFDVEIVQNIILSTISEEQATFELNKDKTRFGSSAGRNWNLGIMLNKDNRMTIGHKQNQRFRAALHNLLEDHANGISWTREDRQVLAGQISYYRNIDPEYTNYVIEKYERKYDVILNNILYD